MKKWLILETVARAKVTRGRHFCQQLQLMAKIQLKSFKALKLKTVKRIQLDPRPSAKDDGMDAFDKNLSTVLYSII